MRHRRPHPTADRSDDESPPEMTDEQQRDLAIDHANEYLEKFIQVTFTLPRITNNLSIVNAFSGNGCDAPQELLDAESLARLATCAATARKEALPGQVYEAIDLLSLSPRQLTILLTDVYLRFLVLIRLGRLVRRTPRSHDSGYVALDQVALFEALLIVEPRLRSALRREQRLLHVLAAVAIYGDKAAPMRLTNRGFSQQETTMELCRRWCRRVRGHERELGLTMVLRHGAHDTSNPEAPLGSAVESTDVRVFLDFHEPAGADVLLPDEAPGDADRDLQPEIPDDEQEQAQRDADDADRSGRYYIADRDAWLLRLEQAIEQHGEESLEAATCRANLGNLLDDLGDYGEARREHELALQIRRKVLGDEHLDVAHSRNDLAIVLFGLDELIAAEHQHRLALRTRLGALGEDHVDVATSRNNLGAVLHVLGYLEAARDHYERALRIRRKSFSEDHPHVASSLFNLGLVAYGSGKLKDARQYFEQSLQHRLSTLGNEHPDTATSRTSLGLVMHCQGELPAAREQHEIALRSGLKSLGEEHLDIAFCRVNFGNLLADMGEVESARNELETATSVFFRSLGDGHRHTLAAEGYIARLDALENRVRLATKTLEIVVARTSDVTSPTAEYPVIFGRTLRRLGGDPLSIIDDRDYAECLDGPWYPEWSERGARSDR